jgi:hypothetical protein
MAAMMEVENRARTVRSESFMRATGLAKIGIAFSILCFLTGILVWIPNLVYGQPPHYWLLTFIINPFGAVFGYIGRSKRMMLANGIMTVSFFIVMFGGYLFSALFGGRP